LIGAKQIPALPTFASSGGSDDVLLVPTEEPEEWDPASDPDWKPDLLYPDDDFTRIFSTSGDLSPSNRITAWNRDKEEKKVDVVSSWVRPYEPLIKVTLSGGEEAYIGAYDLGNISNLDSIPLVFPGDTYSRETASSCKVDIATGNMRVLNNDKTRLNFLNGCLLINPVDSVGFSYGINLNTCREGL
jgi:hypothetical protein